MTVKQVISGKVRLTVRVAPKVYDELRRVAAEQNVSVNELLARLASEYVSK